MKSGSVIDSVPVVGFCPGSIRKRVQIVIESIGFTGTKVGMTPDQLESVKAILIWAIPRWVHHGDCVGADAQFHKLAADRGIKVHIHPPVDPKLQARLKGDISDEPLPYLERNRVIVRNANLLIAAPDSPTERVRSGTWSTIRYARKIGTHHTIVFPDGSVQEDD